MVRFLASLTLKNLFRHIRRLVLTTLAIAVGIYSFIIVDSMMSGMENEQIKNMVSLETGYFQITPVIPDSQSDNTEPDIKYLFADGPQIVASISKLSEVRGIAPRLLFPVSLMNGVEELPVIGVGIDPVWDRSVFTLKEYDRGQWIHANEPSILVGKKIAELLQIKTGDQVTIRTRTRNHSFQALDVNVKGIISSPDPIINENQVFMPLDTVQKTLEVGASISMVAIKTNSLNHLSTTVTKLKKLPINHQQFKVKTWEEIAAPFLAGVKIRRVVSVIFLILIAIISIIGIINSILLSSLERVREIGILKAIGMTEREIIRLFIYEAIGLGLFGGVLGLGFGIISNSYLVANGIDFQKIYGNTNVGFSLIRFYGVWNWDVMAGVFIFTLIIACLVSYFPAMKAARVDPVASLRQI